MSIPELIQKPALEEYLELFEFDLTKYNEGFFRVIPGSEGATTQAVTWNGDVYSPWAIESEGWEVSGRGPAPRPTITLGNTSAILTALVVNNNDLVGATVRRIRTYMRYTDNGSDPDPGETYPIEEYRINQRLALNNEVIQFELASHIDQENTLLPGRQAMREYCPFVARRWTGTAFDYTDATCPYTEADGPPRDENGNVVTDPANEVFSKKLGTCCKARFGENAELPFGGFPGMARIRTR